MKKMNRMMAIIAVMASGLGAGVAYGAQSDVAKAFDALNTGNSAEVMLTNLTRKDIVNARNKDGDTLIMAAIDAYPIFVKNEMDYASAVGEHKKASEYRADAQKRVNQMVSYFIDQLNAKARRDVLDAQNNQGKTALMLAAQKDLTDTVKILHRWGSAHSVIKKDKQGKRASAHPGKVNYSLINMLKKWEKEAEALIGGPDKGLGKSDLEKDWHVISPDKD